MARSSTAKAKTKFPAYLLDHVFVHLPLQDLYRCQRVCKEWRSVIEYYPALRPTLFTAPPPRSQPQPTTTMDTQLHPVFSAIEQDWSIILSTAVFSGSETKNPKALSNFKVRNNMATYPAARQLEVWVSIDGIYTPDTGRARRGGVGNGERRWNTLATRDMGVRVGDVWDTFMDLLTKTRGIAPEDRTLRETFMTGDYHSFTWGIAHVDCRSSSSTTTTTAGLAIEAISTSPGSAHGCHNATNPPVSPHNKELLRRTFYGSAYRGHFDYELALEREDFARSEKQRLQQYLVVNEIAAVGYAGLDTVTGSSMMVNVYESSTVGTSMVSGSCGQSTTSCVAAECRSRRSTWRKGGARRYEGEFDLMSF